MFVSVLIPCHNEEEALPSLFTDLLSLPSILGSNHFAEVIFIDDGSTDETERRLHRLAEGLWFPAKVLGLEPNQGLGAALREGGAIAVGEVIVTYDADRPYPLQDLPALLAAIEAGADVVTASPWHPEGSAEISGYRRWLSEGASLLYRLRFGKRGRRIHTFTCGYRAYRKATWNACLPSQNGFVATAEILVRALDSGATVVEVPSRLRTRTEGRSKMKSLRVALAHVRLLLRRRHPAVKILGGPPEARRSG